MTARQPQTPQEAAMLDPMGLMSFPMPGRGIFGSGRRRVRPLRDGSGSTGPGGLGAPLDPVAAPGMPERSYSGAQPVMAPPITDAPPPPSDWANQLGPELLANLPQADPYARNGIGAGSGVNGQPATVVDGLPIQKIAPTPSQRGGLLANRGMFGNAASAGSLGAGAPMQPGQAAVTPAKKGFDWRMVAGIVGDALAGLNGQPPLYAQAMWKERAARADAQRQRSEIALRSRLDAAKPDYFTVNNDRVRYDPTTGATETLYTAPEDFDRYARALGAEPGTEEYDLLAQDYILRSSGPTATANDQVVEDHRQGNRIDLEDHRQGNRSALLDQRYSNSRALKGAPTYRQLHPAPRKPAAGRGGKVGGVREGQTATGPGGAKLVYRGGKWVPLK